MVGAFSHYSKFYSNKKCNSFRDMALIYMLYICMLGGADIRRKVDELAVRWKMKDPGRADETTEYSSVPLMDQHGDDLDDQVCVGLG